MRNVDVGMMDDIFRVGQCYVIHNFEVEKNADVVGEVVEGVQWHLEGTPKKVFFNLKNECDNVLSCALWEALALELKDCLDKHASGPVVLLLTMAKIKEARGPYPLSIQNSIMDPSQQSIKTYGQLGTQISGSSSYSNVDRFLYNAQMKYLHQISQVKKPFAEIPRSFAIKWKDHLDETWHLIDAHGNHHMVKYNKSLENPRIRSGWMAIREYYHLEGNCQLTLTHYEQSFFHMTIYKTSFEVPAFPKWHSLYRIFQA